MQLSFIHHTFFQILFDDHGWGFSKIASNDFFNEVSFFKIDAIFVKI